MNAAMHVHNNTILAKKCLAISFCSKQDYIEKIANIGERYRYRAKRFTVILPYRNSFVRMHTMRSFVLLFLLFLSVHGMAQPLYTADRKQYLTSVLSDTGMGEGFFITLKIKSTTSDSTYLYLTSNDILFSYFRDKKGWTGKEYMTRMGRYILPDVPFYPYQVDSALTERIAQMRPVQLNHCKRSYRDLTVDGLIKVFNVEKVVDDACLWLELMKNNVYLTMGEEDMYIAVPPEVGQ